MSTFIQDIRYSVRTLMNSPGFTIVAILTLALGIGANTALFTVVNAVILKPLPYPDPEQLAMIWQSYPDEGYDQASVSAPNYMDWRKQSESFRDMSTFRYKAYNLVRSEEPVRLIGVTATSGFFNILGVQPILGRIFLEHEDQPDAEPVIVLAHDMWHQHFGADDSIIGQIVTLNGVSYTVVGVMPQGFNFPGRAALWVPYVFTEKEYTSRGLVYLRVVGRLQPDVTLQQAQVEMDGIASRLAKTYPDSNLNSGVSIIPLHEQEVGDVKPALYAVFIATGFVLLLACTNIANLLLTRAAIRTREIAIRTALGAGRLRLVRQFLTESLLLSAIGGAVGILIAIWGTDILVAISPSDFPRLNDVSINLDVIWFVVIVSIVTGILFGLVPALYSTRSSVYSSLKEGGGRTSGSRQSVRIRHGLVIAEVALGLVLLVGAGLMIQTIARLKNVDPGYEPHGVLTTKIALPKSKYPNPEQQAAFYRHVLERIRSTPGVVHASAVSTIPMSGGELNWSFTIEGRPEPPPGKEMGATWDAVAPYYFKTLGIPLIKGRVFTELDLTSTKLVLVISETMAKRFWPDEDPIGQQLSLHSRRSGIYEIIGVVGDIHHANLSTIDQPHMYVTHEQDSRRSFNIMVRADGDPMMLAGVLRDAVRFVDPEQPTSSIRTLDYYVNDSMSQTQFTMRLLVAFALVGLVLAGVGIYGVMAYSVTQRTHEIGIRMALGAQVNSVLGLIIKQGSLLIGAGVVMGLLGAVSLTHLLSSMLYSVQPNDPVTLVSVSILLASVAMFACYIPARRATKVDPMVALRCE